MQWANLPTVPVKMLNQGMCAIVLLDLLEHPDRLVGQRLSLGKNAA